MSYNKFSNVSKLGSEIIRNGGGLTPIMERGVINAMPIWEMLNITKEQYQFIMNIKPLLRMKKPLPNLLKRYLTPP
jgi:hypothetical protein